MDLVDCLLVSMLLGTFGSQAAVSAPWDRFNLSPLSRTLQPVDLWPTTPGPIMPQTLSTGK